MYEIVLLDDAITDIKDAHNWYEDGQKGLGKRLQKSVFDKIALVEQDPLLYQEDSLKYSGLLKLMCFLFL